MRPGIVKMAGLALLFLISQGFYSYSKNGYTKMNKLYLWLMLPTWYVLLVLPTVCTADYEFPTAAILCLLLVIVGARVLELRRTGQLDELTSRVRGRNVTVQFADESEIWNEND